MSDIKKRLYLLFLISAVVLSLTMTAAVAAAATEVSGYERLAVSFWPEYDHRDPDKAVLVIYRGLLPEEVQLPARVRFLIPKNASVLAATAVDSGGRLLTQTFDQLPAGDFNELAYNVDFREFQFEFYYYPVGEKARRDFDFNVRLTVPVKTLEFEIQKPLRATDFRVEPASSDVASRRDQSGNNFEYHNYTFTGSEAADYDFKVAYAKTDANPSVTPQPEIERDGVADTEAARAGTFPVLILIGLIVAGAAIVLILVRRRSMVPVSTRGGLKTGIYVKRPGAKKAKHCKNCGAKLEAGVKFCPECGVKV